ncbi:ABC transporter [Devosia riboflavina]|uniref:ABC transporter n=1 Tax=Devosia riboflavina TaxID=46914 RepID=A0A087LZI7_9HYPH|nr:ABC transporter [Devosia riboflavina]
MDAQGITKSFAGIHALRGASLVLRAGEAHGLVGANGAGKSTFIKILAGLIRPDEGQFTWDGSQVSIGDPHHATHLGMTFIHQELAFIPHMTVLENIMLGLPKRTRLGSIDWQAIGKQIAPIAQRVGLDVPLGASAKTLSPTQNWLVNICRALVRDARLIVMDEPTAALAAPEAERLMAIVEDLTASGVAVLYVSHRLDEVMRLCKRATVFQDGRSIGELSGPSLSKASLIKAIVGGELGEQYEPKHFPDRNSQVALRVEGLSRAPRVKPVSFDLHRGEILGVGGLVGAGRSELARLIYGADKRDSGIMELEGQSYDPRSSTDAVQRGIGLVPEERRAEGIIPHRSIAFNMHLSSLAKITFAPIPILNWSERKARAKEIADKLLIKPRDVDVPVVRLSGGNQQKVVIGRWLLRRPKVLILDEPTRGVDIGARAEIHRLISQLATEGVAVLVISSDPDELPELCHRVIVLAEGAINGELNGSDITRNAIIAASYA